MTGHTPGVLTERLSLMKRYLVGALVFGVSFTGCAPALDPAPQATCTPTQALQGVKYGPVAVTTFDCTSGAGVITTTARIERQTPTGWVTVVTGPAQAAVAPGTASSEAVQYCNIDATARVQETIRAVASDTTENGRNQFTYASTPVALSC